MTQVPVNRDGEAVVIIERDKLQAYLEISPPEGSGNPCDIDQAKRVLKEKHVVYGLIEDNIKKALLSENWGRRILVAKGEPARDGIDAQIIFKFPLPGDRTGPKVDEKGNVDYHDLGLIYNVHMGDFLVEKIPATEGSPGCDISGKVILPRKGKDIPLPRGKNTIADENETKLFAAIDGHVALRDNKVEVSPVYNLSGDVDYSSGNVNFVGDVIINGNVNAGFRVEADGDIEISGFIEGAEVVAGGSVLVKGGITTGIKGFVRAEGDIYARFIENSRVEAGRDIVVRESIMQSVIKAGGAVKVSDKKATIVGGIIQAFEGVESKYLGSQLATQTIIEVGINPQYRQEYQQKIKLIKEKKKSLEHLNHNLQIIQKSNVALEKLSSEKRLALVKMLENFKSIRKEVAELEERIVFLENEFQKVHNAKVNVLEIAYPGVRISIGQSIYIINDPIKYSAFVLEDGEVRVSSLR